MLPVVYALLFAFALVLATVFIHYEVLRSTWLASRVDSMRLRMVLLLCGIFLAHILEISLYAVAYYFMDDHFGLGTISGNTQGALFDYFYFSLTSFTTLGFGDLYPHGPIRIVVGVEALNGFVLIGWSTSFTYLAMQRLSRAARTAEREMEGPKGRG